MRMFETGTQCIPQVQEFVAQQQTVILIYVVLDHLLRSTQQKLFQLVIGSSD